jgi:hypothetical protein
MMTDDVLVLIASYVAAVRGALVAIEAHLRTTSLLDTVRENPELRSGALDSTTTYAFHGVGCCVMRGDRTIDFDFGPNGAVGGFDAWRLWLFAEGDPKGFPRLQDRELIEAELRKLCADGAIRLPKSAPSPHLYYLTAETSAVDAVPGK